MGPNSPFNVNEDNALDALVLAWGDLYDIWIVDAMWHAGRKNAEDMLSGATPDELNMKIRADWLARQPGPVPPHRGPVGMGPS